LALVLFGPGVPAPVPAATLIQISFQDERKVLRKRDVCRVGVREGTVHSAPSIVCLFIVLASLLRVDTLFHADVARGYKALGLRQRTSGMNLKLVIGAAV
jgi:hypothetical protein